MYRRHFLPALVLAGILLGIFQGTAIVSYGAVLLEEQTELPVMIDSELLSETVDDIEDLHLDDIHTSHLVIHNKQQTVELHHTIPQFQPLQFASTILIPPPELAS